MGRNNVFCKYFCLSTVVFDMGPLCTGISRPMIFRVASLLRLDYYYSSETTKMN
jgi:hypothetical protein